VLALGFSLLGILSETQQNAARPAEAGYLFSLNESSPKLQIGVMLDRS